LAHGLALKLRHDGVVDIEGGLHMVICIIDMEIWQQYHDLERL